MNSESLIKAGVGQPVGLPGAYYFRMKPERKGGGPFKEELRLTYFDGHHVMLLDSLREDAPPAFVGTLDCFNQCRERGYFHINFGGAKQ